ncbi:MAG: YkgJ family cysteine cluster protein, partial [Candidatus Delongbacteria bacterium]|nr:YkgJ family cysteine cluster protein [Candidatus Delongbacteria bacterium]
TASYDADKFRQFILESSFLTLYNIDDKTLEKIRSDDVALIEFGFRWLNSILFKDGIFKVNEEAAAQRIKKE